MCTALIAINIWVGNTSKPFNLIKLTKRESLCLRRNSLKSCKVRVKLLRKVRIREIRGYDFRVLISSLIDPFEFFWCHSRLSLSKSKVKVFVWIESPSRTLLRLVCVIVLRVLFKNRVNIRPLIYLSLKHKSRNWRVE